MYFNKPSDSDIYEFEVEEGDVLIFASDGLFDNLFYREIKEIVSLNYDKNSNKQELSELLSCKIAR